MPWSRQHSNEISPHPLGSVSRNIDANHTEKLSISTEESLSYNDFEEEPKLHWRTFVACASLFLLNLVITLSLEGPVTVLTYIGSSLNGTALQTWIPNAPSLVQAVLGLLIASISDRFQARKTILVVFCTISLIGSAIAPGAQSIERLIVAQILIGFGFAALPLAYSIPSEILPRKWRPIVQGMVNISAGFGAIAAPLSIGAFVEKRGAYGWKNFYWIQMALWGTTALGILFGYRPPKRRTELDHLGWVEKVLSMDLMGFFLLTSGLTLFLTGMTIGGSQYIWTDSRVLGTLIVGGVTIVLFALYEWKGTSTGVLHHDLFRSSEGREGLGLTFALCMILIALEAVLLFAFMIFYPILTVSLFETNPFLQALRGTTFFFAGMIVNGLYGLWSSKLLSFRVPLAFGFTLFTAGIIGLATIEPDNNSSTNAVVFAGLAGAGFGAPLVLIISAAHLAVPHEQICTATAVITSTRAVAASVFTAILTAVFTTEESSNLTSQVGPALIEAGLPSSSVQPFIAALSSRNQTALTAIPGVTPMIVQAGAVAIRRALSDSIRVVWEIAAPFGAVAVVCCLFLGDLSKVMDFRVDAPVEKLKSKRRH